jgi:hypothetical protein
VTDLSTLMAQAAEADLTPNDLKTRLPIPFVLERFGIQHSLGPDGKVHAACPFHPDDDPSFDVFGEHYERWGCYPCGKGGDVFDLLTALGVVTNFSEARTAVEGLIAALAQADYQGPTKQAPRIFDAKAAAERVAAAYYAESDGLDAFVSRKNYPFDAAWLKENFEVGSEGATVLIPHYDRDRNLVGFKRRTAETKPIAAGGASFTAFYGEWRDSRTKPVILTEGESDAWVAAYYLSDRYDVLALPTGAGTNPDTLAERIAGRDVTLAFDGDNAGRLALGRWYQALASRQSIVRIVPMPDDTDLAELANLEEVVSRARAVPFYPPDALSTVNGGYSRTGKETQTPVSNWTFQPQRELIAEDGQRAYEGVILPSGDRAVITSGDLSTKTRLVAWANRHGGTWMGSDRDGQVLLGMLQAQGPFLATGRMTSVVGLHDWHFILPDLTIGPDTWRYVAPPGNVHLEDQVFIKSAEQLAWGPEQVHILRSLHDTSVMDPILAWLAAAPVRSTLRSFPFLAVTGSSGTGKTTLTEAVLRAFTGTTIGTNLTSTTRYAVSAFAESTNALPVWFDEYRPGARSETLDAVRQLLRDAFDGAASARGGTGDHWAEVARRPATAPLLISGEDRLTETSLVERMVSVALPLEGRNPEALARIKRWGDTGLPLAYLGWLVGSYQLERLWLFENYEAGPDRLPPRNRTGLGVLDLGWKLLTRFVDEFGGADLGEPDWSLIVGEAAEAATRSPIEDALRWAYDEMTAQGEIIGQRGEGEIWLRVQNFVQLVTRAGFILPGGPEAVKQYLKQHYGAYEGKVVTYGTQKRALVIPGGLAVVSSEA